ncbi:MAG: hypothetical protein KDB82_06465 [Planctomycetes bacterium]|nr:hypothetical protein [Planctomycetota bacterium]
MIFRGLILLLLCALGTSLYAEGMSEDYVRARTDAKYDKPYGFGIEWDLYGYIPWFEQMQKVRADGLPGDRIGNTKDLDGSPIGFFGGTDVRFRFSWHDSIELGYNAYYVRAFDDGLKKTKRWNGLVYAPGTDLDYAADYHELRIMYRRDLFRLGLTKSFTFYVKAGLEYAYISTSVGSDTFKVTDNRDKETFSELLPWWTAGFGVEIDVTDSIKIGAEARGTYEVGFTTLQKRDKENMKQSIWGLTGVMSFEWKIVDWFALIARVHYRYLKVRLYGGYRQDNFLWYSLGPDIGFGLRF